MATIKDIARIANVSPSTVSFVLNGKAREMKVSPVTEQRILEIVAATGYRPSNVARRLRASAAERCSSVMGGFDSAISALMAACEAPAASARAAKSAEYPSEAPDGFTGSRS